MSPMGASSGRRSGANGDGGQSGGTNAARYLASVTKLGERLRFSAGMLAHQRRGLRYGREFDGAGADRATSEREPSALETYFDEHLEGPGIWKWRHYFDIYDRHLRIFRGRPVHMVEIGVYAGGSIGMWRQYFGPESHIYGVDIEPSCLEHAAENVEIFIGDQSSPEFWARFVTEVPRIDVVLDDGGHTFDQQVTSLECLLPHLAPGGVYICEDTVGIANPFHDYAVGLARNLHSDKPMEGNSDGEAQVQQTALQRAIGSIHVYPFVTVIEKRADSAKQFELRRHGTQWPTFG